GGHARGHRAGRAHRSAGHLCCALDRDPARRHAGRRVHRRVVLQEEDLRRLRNHREGAKAAKFFKVAGRATSVVAPHQPDKPSRPSRLRRGSESVPCYAFSRGSERRETMSRTRSLPLSIIAAIVPATRFPGGVSGARGCGRVGASFFAFSIRLPSSSSISFPSSLRTVGKSSSCSSSTWCRTLSASTLNLAS